MNKLLRLSALSFLICLFSACSGHSDAEDHDHDHDHEEDEHTAAAGVKISDEQIQNFGISFESVTPGSFREVIKVAGEIEAAGTDLYTITAKKSGIVKLADGITQGATIDQGKLIATISSAGLEGGDISEAAAANLKVAKAEYERLKPLYEDKLITASQFREAERVYEEAKALAGAKPTAGTVSESSPIKGVITNLLVNSGEYLEKGRPIAVISKNTQMTLKAEVPARMYSAIGEIESANFISESTQQIVKLKDLDGKKISGSSAGKLSNGYIPVYFTFSGNPSYSGFAEVYLLGRIKSGVISVPRGAIMEIQGNKYIYTENEGGNYEKRLVVAGLQDGERVEIKEGLSPGEKIVSDGASIVRMLELSAVAPPAHTHNH